MKEATGELNMTVITLVAVAAVGLLFYLVIWPMVQRMVVNQTCSTYGSDYEAVKQDKVSGTTGSAEISDWFCCPKGKTTVADGCIATD